MMSEGGLEKIKFILAKVEEEKGHIGVIGPIEFTKFTKSKTAVPGTSVVSDISIYANGSLKYKINGRERNNPMNINQILPEILNGIYESIVNNKYL